MDIYRTSTNLTQVKHGFLSKDSVLPKTLVMLVSVGTIVAHAQIPYPNPIKHVVMIIQENRTPDNLFRGLLTWPGINPANYNIATSGKNSKGQTISLTPGSLGTTYDLSHSHASFLAMYDGGKMDGADKIPCFGTCPSNPQFAYVDNAKHLIDPYLTLAAQYGWANFSFKPTRAQAIRHQFLFGATSATSASDDAAGTFVAGIPGAEGSNYTGFMIRAACAIGRMDSSSL